MKTVVLVLVAISSILIAQMSRDAKGIVRDSKTQLEWQDDNNMSEESTIYGAKEYCLNKNLDGYGWRVPTIEELQTILTKKEPNPPRIADIFINTKPDYYRSSSYYDKNSSFSWIIYFGSGYRGIKFIGSFTNVICVRDINKTRS